MSSGENFVWMIIAIIAVLTGVVIILSGSGEDAE